MTKGAQRPLPFVREDTEPFWTGGAHGELRIPRCTNCQRLLHPSQVACPDCRSSDLEHVTTSGRGTVVGVTVNHHQWHEAFPPPYVIGLVALEEDPRVRLTTTIVGDRAAGTAVGRKARVTFEHHEDVWLPVFEVEHEEPVTVPEVPLPSVTVRPMVTTKKFEDRVALTGVGYSAVGRRLGRPPVAMTVEACRAAVDDAGLGFEDIDGLSTYPGFGMGGLSEGGIRLVEEALDVHPTWHNGASETSGPTGAVVNAMLAVASGLCRHVLCFRTVWESTYTGPPRPSRVDGEDQWRYPFGAMSAANWIALNASHYLARFGATREVFGQIAINARTNAARNPMAIYRDPLTMDDYLGARMITTPFGLYDCDVPCDGSTAVVVSAIDGASDLRQPPVLVDAVGTHLTERMSWDQSTLTHEPLVFGAASHLWTRTSLRPGDVDVAELYDGFTFNCLCWLEALGFCGVGEGTDYLEGGKRIALDGELPVNTHGGQLSAGRLHGFGFLAEAMLQLRGTAGARQVPGAEVAVVTTGGGHAGGCLLLTSHR